MRSPIVAMLWEIWRVTRVEAAWKLAFGIVGGLAVLALCAALAPADNAKRYEDITDNGAAIALILLVLPHLVGWLSLARLNGGRPGFPLYLHYTRPVRTAVIVGLPMAYLTAMSSGIPRVGASPGGDLGLCVPTAARRRMDRGPHPGLGGGDLVDP